MWAVLCTNGELNISAFQDECVPEKWVPIFIYKIHPEDNPIVPLFYDELTTRKFAKRNTPKKWIKGGIELTNQDIEWMKEKGWIIKEMNYPHKVDNFICGFEILEFEKTPDFKTKR